MSKLGTRRFVLKALACAVGAAGVPLVVASTSPAKDQFVPRWCIPKMETMVELIDGKLSDRGMWPARAAALVSVVWPALEIKALAERLDITSDLYAEVSSLEGLHAFIDTFDGTSEASTMKRYLYHLPGYTEGEPLREETRCQYGYVKMQIDHHLGRA